MNSNLAGQPGRHRGVSHNHKVGFIRNTFAQLRGHLGQGFPQVAGGLPWPVLLRLHHLCGLVKHPGECRGLLSPYRNHVGEGWRYSASETPGEVQQQLPVKGPPAALHGHECEHARRGPHHLQGPCGVHVLTHVRQHLRRVSKPCLPLPIIPRSNHDVRAPVLVGVLQALQRVAVHRRVGSPDVPGGPGLTGEAQRPELPRSRSGGRRGVIQVPPQRSLAQRSLAQSGRPRAIQLLLCARRRPALLRGKLQARHVAALQGGQDGVAVRATQTPTGGVASGVEQPHAFDGLQEDGSRHGFVQFHLLVHMVQHKREDCGDFFGYTT
eukprot:jgi/Botrbrau1/20633/Bobra.113_1s0058.1